MAKYYTPREMKGELQDSIPLKKIKVSIVENVYTAVKPENRVRHIDDLEFMILQNEEGRYDLEYLKKYVARRHKLLLERSTRPLKGVSNTELLQIQLFCRKPMGEREREQLEAIING